MAKQRPSLEQMARQGEAEAPQEALPAVAAKPAQAGQVVELRKSALVAEQGREGRKDRPHTTLYLDKKVQKVIKEIALQYDRKPHDLYIEGINLMLQHYGRPSVKEIRG